MKADIKARWISALRSGEFVQGKNALNRDGEMCCLGVLCELAVADGVLEAQLDDEWNDNRMAYVVDGDHETQLLPPVVQQWAGLSGTSEYGDVPVTLAYERLPNVDSISTSGDVLTSLSELNDEHDFDFLQIADVIEEQL